MKIIIASNRLSHLGCLTYGQLKPQVIFIVGVDWFFQYRARYTNICFRHLTACGFCQCSNMNANLDALIFVGSILQHSSVGALTHPHLLLQLTHPLPPALCLLDQLWEEGRGWRPHQTIGLFLLRTTHTGYLCNKKLQMLCFALMATKADMELEYTPLLVTEPPT